jgi:hypothetical protein
VVEVVVVEVVVVEVVVVEVVVTAHTRSDVSVGCTTSDWPGGHATVRFWHTLEDKFLNSPKGHSGQDMMAPTSRQGKGVPVNLQDTVWIE